jgi:hypothetical protein
VAICPFATKKLIRPGSNDPHIVPRVAILHVDAANASSLHDYFDGPSGGIESHFFVKRDGGLEQYRDTDWQADANYLANDFAISIETQGYGAGEWTPEQLDMIKRLLTWVSDQHAIPLRKVPAWDGAGVGYHTQFGAPGPWTPVSKSCPGPDRIRQFNNTLVPWMESGARVAPKEDDMAFDLMDLMRHDLTKKGDITVASALRDAHQAAARSKRIERAVSEIGKALDKLAPGVAKAVEDALADATVDVAVTVKHPEEK